jgi:hypothetical protein
MANEDHAELIVPDKEEQPRAQTDVVTEPAKVIRIGSMIRALLEEAKSAPLDESSRTRALSCHEHVPHSFASRIHIALLKFSSSSKTARVSFQDLVAVQCNHIYSI